MTEEVKKKKTRKSVKKSTKGTKNESVGTGKLLVDYMEEAICRPDSPMTPIDPYQTINIKMKFPRLKNETDEEYCKRFPKQAHDGDIGFDVTAIDVDYDEEHDRYMYHTGIYCETAVGDGCFLMPRSGNSKKEAQLGNGIGLVETVNYRGEMVFAFKNRTSLWNEAFRRAIWEWAMLPWYKRIFKDFSIMLDEVYEFCKKNALIWAPYKVGERIGQMVWMKFPHNINIEIVDELSETERGAGGFGSTGK